MKNKIQRLLIMCSKLVMYGTLMQIILFSAMLASPGKAQENKKVLSIKEATISLQVQDYGVEQVLKAIEQKTDYRFFYDRKFIDRKTRLDISAMERPVSEVLLVISEKAGLKFRQMNDVINVTRISSGEVTEDLVMDISMQTVTITGRVNSSDDNAGLPGANVVIKGTNLGTVTDTDGKYSIDVVGPESILVFSSVGYLSEEVTVGNRSIIDITLSADITSLDEIVVIGYGSLEKRDLTGSVGSLKANEFDGEAIASFGQGMQGKIAGVNITSSNGAPGGNMIVRIRGNSSILGSNDPLYVVDGFPIQDGGGGSRNFLNTINPSDIESIEVLKDASATAIYGSRGSNGVIIITTKQGKGERHTIDFETSIGVQEVQRKLNMMDSRQFIELANERQINDGRQPIFTNVDELAQVNTDWQQEIFQPAVMQNHSIRFSGSTATTRYSISGSIFDQQGIIEGSDFNRASLRINMDQDISRRLTLSTRIFISRSASNEVNDGLILLSALSNPPFLPVRNSDGSYTTAAELKQFPFSPSSGENPVALAREQLNYRIVDRVMANVSANYKITDALSFNVLLGIDQVKNETDFYNPRILEAGLPAGSGSMSFSSTNNYLNENTIVFNKNLRSRDKLSIVAGFTVQHEQFKSLLGSSSFFVSDDLQNYNLNAGEIFSAPQVNFSEWSLISWLARINYSLEDKYLFTLTGRTDGSSRFGSGNKWGYFPSGAFAWRLSDESFIKDNISQISSLKLRVSAGITGNQAISPFQSLQRFQSTSLAFGGVPTTGFAAVNLENSNLRWENTKEFNTGFDISLWDHRIALTADYYIKRTTDLLALVNLPPTAGFATMLQNIGSTQNQGVEFEFKTDIIRDRKFLWNLSFNAAHNQNIVLETAGGQDIIAPTLNIMGSANIVRPGEPLGAFFGFQTDGLTENGLFKYVDQNEDGQINIEDRVILGDPYPTIFYGATSHMSYGNFSLRISIQGEHGKLLWNNNRYNFMSSFHRGNNQVVDVSNRWRSENPNPNAPFPRATETLNQQPSDWFIENASYLRLQNVRLDYNIPTNGILKSLRSASIYLSAQNLFVITDYSWYSPDINAFASGDLRIGIDQQTYPLARTFMVGLNIGF
ncbi:MAG: TonB-dependent receptor [Cyclobacteriaceae bacterium]|nr:TonB-dependent receptor [Cyclobacteriaceae bacterium]